MIALCGCGPGRGDVSGVVKYKDRPLPGGTITFYDEYNGAKSSPIAEDGAYEVKDVAVGTAKIAVVTPIAGLALPGMKPAQSTPIDPKYGDREKSGLTCKVKSGPQTHEVVLE